MVARILPNRISYAGFFGVMFRFLFSVKGRRFIREPSSPGSSPASLQDSRPARFRRRGGLSQEMEATPAENKKISEAIPAVGSEALASGVTDGRGGGSVEGGDWRDACSVATRGRERFAVDSELWGVGKPD